MNKIEADYVFIKPMPDRPGFNPADQFPGAQYGATLEQIRSLIGRQKSSQGFTLAVPVGSSEFNIRLPGDAALLLGLVLHEFNAGESFSLKVNNETILDAVPLSCFTNLNKTIPDEYYMIPRPLSGNDSIIVQFTATGSRNENLIFHYLKRPIQ